MMNWKKKGLIFNPEGQITWAKNTALQPTPLVLSDRIRVFVGFRDENGISRVGWVDLDLIDPTIVLGFSKVPALDIGLPGTFDDNGVVPTAVVQRGKETYLYYAGYQLVKNVRFIAFCGLAISTDNGLTFTRYKNTPVLDRTSEEFLFRVIHTITYHNNVWKVWYGGGNKFVEGEQKTLPIYDIRYMESADGINFPMYGTTAIKQGEGEYRVGRPYVLIEDDKYRMFFGASTDKEPYRLAYAESADGITWQRKDELLNLSYEMSEFDSQMSAYPSVVKANGCYYMFYNGNNYGLNGFGLAVLKNE